MKLLLSALFSLTFATTTFATSSGYVCVADPSQEMELEHYVLPGYLDSIGVLTVKPEFCNLTVAAIYRDGCKIGSHTLLIALEMKDSVIVTKDGKKFNFACEKDEVVSL